MTNSCRLALLALACIAGCGGASPSAVAGRLEVYPAQVNLAPGGLASFSATTGTAVTAVTWKVNESAGGQIDAQGHYAAPSSAGTFHVVATSVADASKTGTATVTVSTPSGTCLGSTLLTSLGKTQFMVGFSSSDDTPATQAPFDIRYQYISGNIESQSQPCADWNWWGCWWQDLSQPPGSAFPSGYIAAAQGRGEIAMFTYYMILNATGGAEGAAEVTGASNLADMTRYLGDFRFLAQKIGAAKVLVHIEPDFWGYAQQVNSNPHAIPAAVASADPTDCAGYEESIAGLGQCMVHILRTYAPNAKVGLHASGWATKVDVLLNTNASFDVAGEAAKVGEFLSASGGSDCDLVVVEMSDRDAGYYQSIGQDRWWDATNATLPDFAQDLTWVKALAEAMAKPALWWQVPVGNMSLDNTSGHWKDNRVQYFFDHPAEFASAHGVGIAFGSGASGQTDPTTDGGYLVSRTQAYASAGATAACP